MKEINQLKEMYKRAKNNQTENAGKIKELNLRVACIQDDNDNKKNEIIRLHVK